MALMQDEPNPIDTIRSEVGLLQWRSPARRLKAGRRCRTYINYTHSAVAYRATRSSNISG